MGSSPTRGSSFFLGKVTALGALCCFALFVCLFDLSCFFLSSISYLIKTCTRTSFSVKHAIKIIVVTEHENIVLLYSGVVIAHLFFKTTAV